MPLGWVAPASPAVGTARQGAGSDNCAPVIRARSAWPTLPLPPQAERKTAAIRVQAGDNPTGDEMLGPLVGTGLLAADALLLPFLPAKASSLPSTTASYFMHSGLDTLPSRRAATTLE